MSKLTATDESTGLLSSYKLASLAEGVRDFRAQTNLKTRLQRSKMDDWDDVAPPQPHLDDDLYVSNLHERLQKLRSCDPKA
jgi:hypothetical protein